MDNNTEMYNIDDSTIQQLKKYVSDYYVFRKSSSYNEQYKYDFAEKHKDTFSNLDDEEIFKKNFEQLINDCGKINISPYSLMNQPKMFLEILNKHTQEIVNLFKSLFDDNIDLAKRIDSFITKFEELRDKSNWTFSIGGAPLAVFFLFINNYKKYPLFSKVEQYKSFFSFINFKSFLDIQHKNTGYRYKVVFNFIHDLLIPVMNEVNGTQNFAIDAQDFIWCFSNLNKAEQGDNMNDTSYLNSVIKALKRLGGKASLSQIYKEVYSIRTEENLKINNTYDSTVRYTLESHSSDSEVWKKQKKKNKDIFKWISDGVWALREEFFENEDIIKDNVNENIDINESNTNTKITKQSLNQILYGPPGTGKTYNTVIKAMEIIDSIEYKDITNEKYTELKNRFDELKQSGQIEFITFHQSYSYEEFIEGIKPNLGNKDLNYILEDGILKTICDNAKKIKTDKAYNKIDFSKTRIFKMSLGAKGEDDTENIYNYCLQNNVVALGWGGDKDFSQCKNLQDFKKLDIDGGVYVERFKNWMQIGDIILISNGNFNIKAIAQITGDYEYHNDTEIKYCQYRKVKWLYSGDNISISKIYDKNLSQQTIYGFYDKNREGESDYNTTIKTDVINDIITGNINKIEEKPYILIIDEINRGNISKIFGEMITLIEEDKRIGNEHELKLTLPYSKELFGIPNNLYIIGTMNTSDRSIASVDIALRRRFKFIEMMPQNELVADFEIDFDKIFESLNTKIKILLDRDHQIGHSYFIKTKYNDANGNNNIETLKNIWFDEILPLLNEYFYNDWDKLNLILPGFITKIPIPESLKEDFENAYEFKPLKDFEKDEDFINAFGKEQKKDNNE